MLRKLRPRSVYDVAAALSLFLALGGTAYAVAANSVGTAQLKNGAVTNPKLAASSVGTGKVIDGSLLARDFKPGQFVADHYATIDLPGTGAASKGTTILRKGPFTLDMACGRDASGNVSMGLGLTAAEKYTYSDSHLGSNAPGGGHAGSTVQPLPNGTSTTLIGQTPQENSFYWYGGATITAISASTSLDGVFSFGVNGYHDCEASFFGG